MHVIPIKQLKKAAQCFNAWFKRSIDLWVKIRDAGHILQTMFGLEIKVELPLGTINWCQSLKMIINYGLIVLLILPTF